MASYCTQFGAVSMISIRLPSGSVTQQPRLRSTPRRAGSSGVVSGTPALAHAKVSGWSLLCSAVYLGIATAARDFAVQFARERVPTAIQKPIAELPNVQHRIAQIEILLLQARSTLYSTIETFENHPEHRAGMGWQMAAAKYTVTNHAVDITDLALRVTGSAGLLRKYPLALPRARPASVD